jgi:hypothetical protein
VKRTNIFVALSCALLVLVLAGCGSSSNNLQSIELSAKLINGAPPTAQSGVITLQGLAGTVQLQAIGTYSSTKTKDLSNEVTYNVVVDPVHGIDQSGVALLPPCVAPCSDPTKGTLEYSNTGLLTAVEPAVCSWVNQAVDPAPTPAWFYSGDYVVTASFGGVTSQPVYVPIASLSGIYDQYSNPNSLCGPGA